MCPQLKHTELEFEVKDAATVILKPLPFLVLGKDFNQSYEH